MAKTFVKKNSTVRAISGAEKGKVGKVLSVDASSSRAVVEGLNRHRRTLKRSAENPQGGIIEAECPIHISNLMLEEEYQRRQAKRGASVEKQAEEAE
jgi:large subunit ribosomal protein L24